MTGAAILIFVLKLLLALIVQPVSVFGLVLAVTLLTAVVLTCNFCRAQRSAEAALLSVQAKLRDNVCALEESESQFRSVISAMQEGLLVHDADGVILLCNHRAQQMLGLSAEELVGGNALRGGWPLLREDGTEFPLSELPAHQSLESGLPTPSVVMGVQRPDGVLTWIQTSAAPLFHPGKDRPHSIVLTFSDVTERRRVLETLRETEEKYRGIYENSTEGIFQTVREGRFLRANPAFARILGYDTPAQLVAEVTDIMRQLYHRPEDREAVLSALAAVGTICGFETPLRRRDGSAVWVSVNVHHARDAQGLIILEGSIHDITERRATEQRLLDYNEVLEFQKREMEKANAELERVNARLEALATQDGLTGLKNHRAFQDRLADEIARARRYGIPLSLVMLDVDHFKQYNDTFGHPAGDQVLLKVAEKLREALRESDYAARYGGEEFVLILPQTDTVGAVQIAERCREALEEAAWEHRPVTASFGVASLLPCHRDGVSLLTDADRLLYQAKAGGRNQVAAPEHTELLDSYSLEALSVSRL